MLENKRYEHKGEHRSECQCPRPFALHKMLKEDEAKRAWLAALNLKLPPEIFMFAPSILWTKSQLLYFLFVLMISELSLNEGIIKNHRNVIMLSLLTCI